MVARLLRNAGAIVPDRHHHVGTAAMSTQANNALAIGALAQGLLENLDSVASKIHEDAEQVVAVGIDQQIGGHVVEENDTR